MDRPSAPAAPLLAFTRFQALCRFSRARAAAAPALCSARHSAGRSLHRCPVQTGLHPVSPRTAPLSRASDAWLPASLCLKHSSSFGPSPRIRLLRPLLTSRSGSTPSPFQAQGEISPGKNAFLHRTTAGSTPPPLGHESFAVHGPLALVGTASYPVLVHRHAVYAPRFLPTLGHPHAVALHFTRCDQLVAGLPPAGMRPCRAHNRKRRRPGWRGPLFCSLLLRSAWIRRGFAERELVPRDPTVKPCSDAFVPLDHDVFRSVRPKNIVIDSKKLRRGMRAENGTHFSSSRSSTG